jgi:predicted glycoside hydrolase/deacetylase ChbG (UPF0249 family)
VHEPHSSRLVIVADDFGYHAAYDAGILAAVRAEVIDAVGVMVRRVRDPASLMAVAGRAGVDVGLHLEDVESDPPSAQATAFQRLLNRPPAYVDGHKHCHATAGVEAEVARIATDGGAWVRSVDAGHRERLRAAGIPTADRLVGRLAEGEPALPAEIAAALAGDLGPGVTEWMVHPGTSGGPSSYDAGRVEDLEVLERLGDRAAWKTRGVLRASFSALPRPL